MRARVDRALRPPPHRRPDRATTSDDERRYDERRYEEPRYAERKAAKHYKHDDDDYKRKKKKSMLSELFDF